MNHGYTRIVDKCEMMRTKDIKKVYIPYDSIYITEMLRKKIQNKESVLSLYNSIYVTLEIKLVYRKQISGYLLMQEGRGTIQEDENLFWSDLYVHYI